jgi:hypothetical protein
MIKEYDLKKQGLNFKSDFNWNFDLIKHLLEVRTIQGYLKIDLIKSKSKNNIYLSRRTTNFNSQKATFEIKEFSCPLTQPYCLLSS